MDLKMDISLAKRYKSASQIARVITEAWMLGNGYCPVCSSSLDKANNNAKVLDFNCSKCEGQFELKSKSGRLGKTIGDGAYSSMMQRITELNKPHFFFLGYDKTYLVTDCIAVPNYFFQPSVIKQRKALLPTAKRAGWIGCNILLDQIPELGKIKLIENSEIISPDVVIKAWGKTAFLGQPNQIETRGWTLDILNCIERIRAKEFNLEQIYKFEPELSARHPNNNFVKDKIRQQLQILRDKGVLEFNSRGKYSIVDS